MLWQDCVLCRGFRWKHLVYMLTPVDGWHCDKQMHMLDYTKSFRNRSVRYRRQWLGPNEVSMQSGSRRPSPGGEPFYTLVKKWKFREEDSNCNRETDMRTNDIICYSHIHANPWRRPLTPVSYATDFADSWHTSTPSQEPIMSVRISQYAVCIHTTIPHFDIAQACPREILHNSATQIYSVYESLWANLFLTWQSWSGAMSKFRRDNMH